MRLVCPNCGAQYEVDDRVIPEGGRDVQCSSCGHAWYQMPANTDTGEEVEPDEAAEALEADEEAAELEAESEPDLEPEARPAEVAGSVAEPAAPELQAEGTAPESKPEPEPEPETAEPETPEPETTEPETTEPEGGTPRLSGDGAEAEAEKTGAVSADEEGEEAEEGGEVTSPAAGVAGAAPPRRELDQNLRAILQEEMAREMAARAAGTATETSPATSPPPADTENAEAAADTGAQPAETPAPATGPGDEGTPDIGPAPTSPHEDEGVFAAAPSAAAAVSDKAPRKNVFPDIEEINSTLDTHGPAEEFEEEIPSEGGGGFGRAFFAIIFIAALALALYAVAPKLAASVPALEPALSGYVDAVNGARAWLDSLLQGLTDQIESGK